MKDRDKTSAVCEIHSSLTGKMEHVFPMSPVGTVMSPVRTVQLEHLPIMSFQLT